MSASRAEPALILVAAPPMGTGGDDPLDPGGRTVGKGSKAKDARAGADEARMQDRPTVEAAADKSADAPTSAAKPPVSKSADKSASAKSASAKSPAAKSSAAKVPAAKVPAAKLPAAKPPAAKSVGWALVQAARLHRARVGDRLAALDLFAGQEQVVQALAVAGSMTMGDLAATLRVRPPTASKTISRLAALGFVERRAEAGDGRIVRVRLTETGLAKAVAIQRIWDEVEAELLDDFEGKERRRLRKLLRKAASNLAEAAGVTGHEPEHEPDLDADEEAEPQLAATAHLPNAGG